MGWWRRGAGNERNRRLFWTFLDQGIVSAGAFVVQITLARLLVPHDYGVFTLIFSALLTLQLINTTLIFFPMSVRIPKLGPVGKSRLLGASLIMVGGMTLLLGVLLAVGLAAFGLDDAVLPALAYLFFWQAQESLRRALFGSLRHQRAVIGDALTYLSPAVLIAGSGLIFGITIGNALYIMAACAAVGAGLHLCALTLAMPSVLQLRAIGGEYWRIGGLASVSSGMLVHTRIMIVPWVLAMHSGPAATAGLQAAMNIVNISNPLIIGLGNLLPQMVAGARDRGLAEAWRLVRGYTLYAAVPMVGYSLLIFLWPGEVLRLFYGSGSAFLGLELPLRLLLLTGLIGFYVEAVLAFLHGASLVGRAAEVNFYGTLFVLLLVFPAILFFGLVGACVVLLAGNLVRLACAQMALARTQHGVRPAIA